MDNPDDAEAEPISVTDMDVISMKKYDGGWRTVLNSDYRTMVRSWTTWSTRCCPMTRRRWSERPFRALFTEDRHTALPEAQGRLRNVLLTNRVTATYFSPR